MDLFAKKIPISSVSQVSLTQGKAFSRKVDAEDPGCDLHVHLFQSQRDAQAFLRGFASSDLVDGVEWVVETESNGAAAAIVLYSESDASQLDIQDHRDLEQYPSTKKVQV